MNKVFIYKAQEAAGLAPDDLVITITEPLPEIAKDVFGESSWRPLMNATFAQEAERLEGVLYNTLPGGTYDALFCVMAKRKASVLVVAHTT